MAGGRFMVSSRSMADSWSMAGNLNCIQEAATVAFSTVHDHWIESCGFHPAQDPSPPNAKFLAISIPLRAPTLGCLRYGRPATCGLRLPTAACRVLHFGWYFLSCRACFAMHLFHCCFAVWRRSLGILSMGRTAFLMDRSIYLDARILLISLYGC